MLIHVCFNLYTMYMFVQVLRTGNSSIGLAVDYISIALMNIHSECVACNHSPPVQVFGTQAFIGAHLCSSCSSQPQSSGPSLLQMVFII